MLLRAHQHRGQSLLAQVFAQFVFNDVGGVYRAVLVFQTDAQLPGRYLIALFAGQLDQRPAQFAGGETFPGNRLPQKG